MKTVKKCCPKCHEAYYVESLFAFSVPWDYGSPLVTCEKCGTKFWDGDRVEIATCGYHKSHASLFSIGSIILAVLFACISHLFYSPTGFELDNYAGGFFALLSILVLVIKAGTYKKRKVRLAKETEESINRFRDPGYVAFLKTKFYPTTDKYIERK